MLSIGPNAEASMGLLEAQIERRTMRQVAYRVLPLIFLLYLFCFLDRTNVSMAALKMNDDLHFSAGIFGFGAGVFFLSYSLFEVPSNLLLARVGARRWIARIALTWGTLACLMMFVRTPVQFYCVRFLLGVAEAGFFPGAVYYLSQWFPAAYRAQANARFMLALSASFVLGGPLGSALLNLNQVGHLAGWQWLFLVEGLPPLVLGLITLHALPDTPETSTWLAPEEQRWLIARLSSEQPPESPAHGSVLRVLGNRLVWLLIVPYFAYYTASLAAVLWGPIWVRDAIGTSDTATGLVIGSIHVLNAAIFLLIARQSDRKAERCGPAALGLALACVGCLIGAGFQHSPVRVLALVMLYGATPVFLAAFWCLPTKLLKGASAAAGIALINAVGASGGFFGPTIIGFAKQLTGNDRGAFYTLAGLTFVGSLVCLALRRKTIFKPVLSIRTEPASS